MKITEEILEAMRKATDGWGGQAEFAQHVGVDKSFISKYLSGATRNMTLETWMKMEHVLRPLMPSGKISYKNNTIYGSAVNANGDLFNFASVVAVRDAVLADPELTPEQKKKIILEVEEFKLNNKLKIGHENGDKVQ